MNKKKLIIFGVGELAELSHYYYTQDSNFEVCAFTLDSHYIESSTYLGLPLVPFEDIEKKYSVTDYYLFIAIGYSKLNENRKYKYNQAKLKGYRLASYVSSKAASWPCLEIGDNTFIMESNTIMPFSKIGNNVLIWVNNDIAHHMIIEDHVTITSHCAIGGNVIIKEQAFIGLNSTIRDGIIIGKGAIISAASNVLNNVEEYNVVMGNPAKLRNIDSRNIDL